MRFLVALFEMACTCAASDCFISVLTKGRADENNTDSYIVYIVTRTTSPPGFVRPQDIRRRLLPKAALTVPSKPHDAGRVNDMSVNTTAISAGQAFDALRAGYAAQAAGKMTASWMLHGRPGIGKTDIVQQLARETGSRLFDLRLTTIEPQDLRGLPFYDHEARRTIWYRPEDLPDDPNRPAILFLDELTAAAPILQPAVYGLLQECRVGPHVLPDTTFIVAAGNAVEDGAVAYEMGTALSDRLIYLNVVANAADWLSKFAVHRACTQASPHLFVHDLICLKRPKPRCVMTR